MKLIYSVDMSRRNIKNSASEYVHSLQFTKCAIIHKYGTDIPMAEELSNLQYKFH
jgi:hypothetical protein